MLDNARREREEMASGALRLATHASTPAVNQAMRHKVQQMPT